MAEQVFDVLVNGSGVAGATCAAVLAGKGLKVALLERRGPDEPAPVRPDWITQPALELVGSQGIDLAEALGQPFDGVTFHSQDLARSTATRESEPPAYRVDYNALVGHLVAQAVARGANYVPGTPVSAMDAGENGVVARCADGTKIRARFGIVADGAADEPAGGHWIAGYAVPLAKRVKDANLHTILSADEEGPRVSWWFEGATLKARLHGAGSPQEVAGALANLLTMATSTGVLPADLKIDPDRMSLRPAPSTLALARDSHVGKRTLVIGDAGGFVVAMSREGIYPAMWSAVLAGETVADAMAAEHPQDALQGFDTLWRTTMAQYLASPVIDTPFLLPLVFSNPQMAQRMARTFWRAESE